LSGACSSLSSLAFTVPPDDLYHIHATVGGAASVSMPAVGAFTTP